MLPAIGQGRQQFGDQQGKQCHTKRANRGKHDFGLFVLEWRVFIRNLNGKVEQVGKSRKKNKANADQTAHDWQKYQARFAAIAIRLSLQVKMNRQLIRCSRVLLQEKSPAQGAEKNHGKLNDKFFSAVKRRKFWLIFLHKILFNCFQVQLPY